MGYASRGELWTEEQIAQLREMIEGGATYGQAAQAFGRTRSAVGGIVKRRGIVSKNPQPVFGSTIAPGLRAGPLTVIPRKPPTPIVEPEPEPEPELAAIDIAETTMEERLDRAERLIAGRNGCGWIDGDPRSPDARRCQSPGRDGWCEKHRKKAHVAGSALTYAQARKALNLRVIRNEQTAVARMGKAPRIWL